MVISCQLKPAHFLTMCGESFAVGEPHAHGARLGGRLQKFRRAVLDLLPIHRGAGGQRQAVAIGRAIFWNARLVIMDEPTAALGVRSFR